MMNTLRLSATGAHYLVVPVRSSPPQMRILIPQGRTSCGAHNNKHPAAQRCGCPLPCGAGAEFTTASAGFETASAGSNIASARFDTACAGFCRRRRWIQHRGSGQRPHFCGKMAPQRPLSPRKTTSPGALAFGKTVYPRNTSITVEYQRAMRSCPPRRQPHSHAAVVISQVHR